MNELNKLSALSLDHAKPPNNHPGGSIISHSLQQQTDLKLEQIFNRMDRIECQIGQGLDRISNLLVELNEMIKRSSMEKPQEAYRLMRNETSNIDHSEQIPCMCCSSEKQTIIQTNIDKCFFSKQEGKELLSISNEMESLANNQSLLYMDQFDNESDNATDLSIKNLDDDNQTLTPPTTTITVKEKASTLAQPELISFNESSGENSLNLISNIEETNFLTSNSYSEPKLSTNRTDQMIYQLKSSTIHGSLPQVRFVTPPLKCQQFDESAL
ncbi:hypothetical protein BLA29_004491 [Euroglyphus maynei]|uniref:Uncharacterized protein n=1 Tax=Euroglyphus maynei TaxID=6958 RepID=A0A1Y3B7Z2_EURMA|nr:hypothetical protein BLA29_004491 [Euroglyphus maynei]